MEQVSLKDYLTCDNQEDITQRLIKLDMVIKYLHQRGLFVVSFDANNIILYNNEFSIASFQNKLDYLDSGYNSEGSLWDILEMNAVGICAYNHFREFYTNKDFINYLRNNLKEYNKNGAIPKEIYEYYKSVFEDGNIGYLTDYLEALSKTSDNTSKGTSRVYTKSTPQGRALSDKNSDNSAFISVLIIPSIMVLGYLLFIVITMIIK